MTLLQALERLETSARLNARRHLKAGDEERADESLRVAGFAGLAIAAWHDGRASVDTNTRGDIA